MRLLPAVLASAAVLALAAPAAGQQAPDFSGRVFDADSKRGIENLEVKLTPPRSVQAPIRVATTNSSGAFTFPKLSRGRYLIEVSQGVNLLYRAEVDTAATNRLEIPLRRKRRRRARAPRDRCRRSGRSEAQGDQGDRGD